MVTGRYSRPDNMFGTVGLLDMIMKCEVAPSLCPPSTDHFPITTNLLLPQERVDSPPTFNFREVDWDEFKKKLEANLNTAPNPQHINTQEQLTTAIDELTQAIQAMIQENLAKTKPRPDAKRWWNRDLRRMKKELNRLRAISFRNCMLADHPSHEEVRHKSNQYREAIIQAK